MLRASRQSHEPQATRRTDEIPVELDGLRVPPQEWRAIVTVRPNVLVEGPDCSTEQLILAVTAALGASVCEWGQMSTDLEPDAILIVRRVDLLSASEHRRLLDYLNGEGDRSHVRVRQVIATSARPLYALVESGAFLADLYYRLNTIRLELSES